MFFKSSLEIIENWGIGTVLSPESDSHGRDWEVDSKVILIELTLVIVSNDELGKVGGLGLEFGNGLVGSLLFSETIKNLLGIGLEEDQKVLLLKLRGSVSIVADNVVDEDFILFSLISDLFGKDLKNLSVEVLFNSLTVIKKLSVGDLALVNDNHGL